MASKKTIELTLPVMGTLARVVAHGATDAAVQAAFARVRELEAILSDYQAESEVNRLVRADGPVPLSPDLFNVLWMAQRVAKESSGAFDVTIGPVTHAWRAARRAQSGPPDTAKAFARCGYRLLKLDERGRLARCLAAGMQLDLGGIAKGYAADEALKVLRAAGTTRAMVALAGDIVAGAAPPGRRAWRIGVAGEQTVDLVHAAVSTSGDSEQFLTGPGGRRFSHVVDPRTGKPMEGDRSVSVTARTGIEADALSTALRVLAPHEWSGLLTKFPGARVAGSVTRT